MLDLKNKILRGEMAEWTKAAASKAVIAAYTAIGGSNPSLSTKLQGYQD